jgi:hypothetical protein
MLMTFYNLLTTLFHDRWAIIATVPMDRETGSVIRTAQSR